MPPSKRTKTKTKTKRTPLTRELVLQTAVTLADQIGIAELSMRRLGQALGVEAMSLYRHVASKEDILDGIVDCVVREIEAPEIGGDWQAAMRKRAVSAHAVLMRHPWATMLLLSRENAGPAMLHYVDATLGCLREAGFSFPMADHACNAVDNYLYGYTLQRLNLPAKADEHVAAARGLLAQLPAEQHPYLRGLTEQIVAGQHDGVHSLELGLDLILEGLEKLRKKGRGR